MTRNFGLKAVGAAALAVLALSACNTVQGFGRDLAAVGDALTSASQDAESNGKLDGGPGSRKP